MKLHNLKRSGWLVDKDIQRGRGSGAKRWDYSGRWLKGQKARSWSNIPWWFEGWQTPLVLKLPKLRWFKKYYKLMTTYDVINLDRLNTSSLVDWDIVSPEVLKKLGMINGRNPVKILWNGSLEKKLIFEWIKSISKSALEAIKSAWWEIN